jgi:hypothetical protein
MSYNPAPPLLPFPRGVDVRRLAAVRGGGRIADDGRGGGADGRPAGMVVAVPSCECTRVLVIVATIGDERVRSGGAEADDDEDEDEDEAEETEEKRHVGKGGRTTEVLC